MKKTFIWDKLGRNGRQDTQNAAGSIYIKYSNELMQVKFVKQRFT